MKHNLRLRVSKEPKDGGVIACRCVSIREKILSKLFGSKQKVMVLVPGDSVETIAITETQEGGGVYE